MDFVFDSWYLLLLAAIIGGLVVTFSRKPLFWMWRSFRDRTQLIKRYWTFVVPFTVLSVAAYTAVWIFVPVVNRDAALDVLGVAMTLIFAIFVGYFAFLQLAENRLDKLIEQGDRELYEKSYSRAIGSYEKALSIDPKNYHVLSNVLELYLMTGDSVAFEERLPRLGLNGVEHYEKLVYLYLCALKYLLIGHTIDARAAIQDAVEFVKQHPEALDRLRWNFSDLRESKIYQDLQGESKELLTNFVRYLERGLGADRQRFENGDYLLVLIPSPQS